MRGFLIPQINIFLNYMVSKKGEGLEGKTIMIGIDESNNGQNIVVNNFLKLESTIVTGYLLTNNIYENPPLNEENPRGGAFGKKMNSKKVIKIGKSYLDSNKNFLSEELENHTF